MKQFQVLVRLLCVVQVLTSRVSFFCYELINKLCITAWISSVIHIYRAWWLLTSNWLSTSSTTLTPLDCVLSVRLDWRMSLVLTSWHQCAVMSHHSDQTTVTTQERQDVTPGSVGPSDHLVPHWRQGLILHTATLTVPCLVPHVHSVKWVPHLVKVQQDSWG